MTLYRQNQIPAYLIELETLRTAKLVMGANDEDVAFFRRFTDGKTCISELEPTDEITIAWTIPTTAELLECVERCRHRDNATISYRALYWRLSDVVHLLRGGGSASYSQISDISELDRAQIRGLASPRSIIPLLRYAAEAAKQPELFPTKAEEERIRIAEKRIFAGLKLEAEKRKFLRTQRTSRDARVALSPSVVSRVLANHQSCCFFSGCSSQDTRLHIHHIIPCRIIELLRLPRELFTAEFNLVPVCQDLNLAKSATLTKEDVALYLKRFAEPSHPNHRVLEYLKSVEHLQNLAAP